MVSHSSVHKEYSHLKQDLPVTKSENTKHKLAHSWATTFVKKINQFTFILRLFTTLHLLFKTRSSCRRIFLVAPIGNRADINL